ncbi:hypothetical protein, partial [Martelella alba]|uniref:hypothetical protein n=1 Tax=Martelella alba TaxID=2590451 RepID=UPI001E57DB72
VLDMYPSLSLKLRDFYCLVSQGAYSQHSTDIHKIYGSALVFYEFYRWDFFKSFFQDTIRSALDAAPFT